MGRIRGAAGRRRGPWIAVAGARPNYVKLGPLVRAARAAGRRLAWVDTGQHRAAAMSAAMARDLALPAPVARLPRVRAGAGRVGRMATVLERVLAPRRPALVVALGDVDSTVAAALAAWRLDLPLAHVEAGLRSGERDLPEERNRRLVDALSDRLYVPEPGARVHLAGEGVPARSVRSPGNVMADALRWARPEIRARQERARARLPEGYVVVTLHRQANVDDPRRLAGWMRALGTVARERPVVFPVHPRTRRRLGRRPPPAGLRLTAPRPWLDFLALVAGAAAVVTDSGGLQVEAALLGVPCVTARERTEHTLTLRCGGNRLAGADPRRLPRILARALAAGPPGGALPRAWGGRAAERIVADWQAGFLRPARRPAPSGGLLEAL